MITEGTVYHPYTFNYASFRKNAVMINYINLLIQFVSGSMFSVPVYFLSHQRFCLSFRCYPSCIVFTQYVFHLCLDSHSLFTGW